MFSHSSFAIGTVPFRSETACLFEPQTICECIEVCLGLCHIEDTTFYQLTKSNIRAHILDRLFSIFAPDDKDKKLQVILRYYYFDRVVKLFVLGKEQAP
jgi:hypothetical protein